MIIALTTLIITIASFVIELKLIKLKTLNIGQYYVTFVTFFS